MSVSFAFASRAHQGLSYRSRFWANFQKFLQQQTCLLWSRSAWQGNQPMTHRTLCSVLLWERCHRWTILLPYYQWWEPFSWTCTGSHSSRGFDPHAVRLLCPHTQLQLYLRYTTRRADRRGMALLISRRHQAHRSSFDQIVDRSHLC